METTRATRLLIVLLLAAAVAIRFASFDFLTDDVRNWVFAWYDYHLEHGVSGLEQAPTNVMSDAGNYPPPFFYFLLVASQFDAWLPKLHLVKLFPTIFDFALAGVVLLIVRRASPRPQHPWIAFFMVLFAPTVLANSALWGQADSIPTTFVAASILAIMGGHPILACMAAGVAISFKATGVFILPFLLMLALRGRIKWAHLLVVPLAYAAMMLPAIIAGRSVIDVLTIYLRQGELYERLSMNAPNLYAFAPDWFYDAGRVLGFVVTAAACAAFALAPVRWRAALTPRFLLLAATLSLLLVPFLLPKMHDRYFYAVDVVAIALAWHDRRLWYAPVLSQLSSAIAYVPILSEAAFGIDDGYVALGPVAVVINTVLVFLLTREYWRSLHPVDVGGRA